MPRGRPIDKDLRKRIAGLLRQGKSQADICAMLDRAPGTIAHHVRALGIAPKEYTTPAPIVKGKRRCTSCGKRKSIGAYPNDRGAECTMCVRAKKETV
jgi:IS30 family transposase